MARLTEPKRPIDSHAAAVISDLTRRRSMGEPIAYLTGTREFWSLELAVTPDTLIPRPDSEALIDAVLANRDWNGTAARVLDLGTGSGCLLLALLSEISDATGIGVDFNPKAAGIAAANAARLG
ncbi:MAG: methyltransferase domain-containing protein, partial [Rhodospirillales bacterium]|nr:methyltransferase domain-containing protein [Rhodospirillales bacterium]